MKRLFVCCDGTWNSPTQVHDGVPTPTNVVRFYNALLKQGGDGIAHERYYHPGVGVSTQFLQVLWEGVTGAGLRRNIKSAYKWLCENYDEGDQIHLIGFSRGAFTVRCVSGMVTRVGLIRRGAPPALAVGWKDVDAAYVAYRSAQPPKFGAGVSTDASIGIHLIGVWDTVGAYGIPRGFSPLHWVLRLIQAASRCLWPNKLYAEWLDSGEFRNLELADKVRHACHAVAIDEKRANYAPTLWLTEPKPLSDGSMQSIEQTWFTGVHADTGGGYREAGLSDIALGWMLERAEAAAAGAPLFSDEMRGQVTREAYPVLHDSYDRFPFKLLATLPRACPDLGAPAAPLPYGQSVHRSALERLRNPPIFQAPYRAVREPLAVGSSITVPIYAREQWNATALYVRRGENYRLTAAGQWRDSQIAPTGPQGGGFGLLRNPFWFLKRCRGEKWMALMGAVSALANPSAAGDAAELLQFHIGADIIMLGLNKDGYLYAFANDAWAFYDNNTGSVMLRIERLPDTPATALPGPGAPGLSAVAV